MNTEEELKRLQHIKTAWFEKAITMGKINQLYFIGRNLGEYQPSVYGVNYKYSNSYIEIFIDNYGQYMTVHLDGKLICSTHVCQKLYIPGDWEDEIEQMYKDAVAKNKEKKEQRELVEIRELKRILGMDYNEN